MAWRLHQIWTFFLYKEYRNLSKKPGDFARFWMLEGPILQRLPCIAQGNTRGPHSLCIVIVTITTHGCCWQHHKQTVKTQTQSWSNFIPHIRHIISHLGNECWHWMKTSILMIKATASDIFCVFKWTYFTCKILQYKKDELLNNDYVIIHDAKMLTNWPLHRNMPALLICIL